MKPLLLSHFTSISCIGRGLGQNLDALRQCRSGLKRCDFDTAELDTYIGEVAGVDDVAIRSDLRDFDCRNNRLLQMTLEQDGFADAVTAAAQKYGHDRVGVFLGTSTAGVLQTELA
ncbi:MAG TPA: beta-ketoacyl-[acyl-carrier-protein] synthase II, partial [Oxalobacteraceae bacterium]|nr:beta-ketoacyl-[acyl-carrier-protein] synthase II [Oxalobacteraceae bacterium]